MGGHGEVFASVRAMEAKGVPTKVRRWEIIASEVESKIVYLFIYCLGVNLQKDATFTATCAD